MSLIKSPQWDWRVEELSPRAQGWVLNYGMAALYPLWEGGGIVYNVLNPGGVGVLSGAMTWATKPHGLALRATALNDTAKVSITDPALGDGFTPEGLTLGFFGQKSGSGQQPRSISKASGGGEADHDWMLSDNYGPQRFRLRTGGVTGTYVATDDVTDGALGFYAAIYNGVDMKIWLGDAAHMAYDAATPKAKTGTVDATAGRPIALLNNPHAGAISSHGHPVFWVGVWSAGLPESVLGEITDSPMEILERRNSIVPRLQSAKPHYNRLIRVRR